MCELSRMALLIIETERRTRPRESKIFKEPSIRCFLHRHLLLVSSLHPNVRHCVACGGKSSMTIANNIKLNYIFSQSTSVLGNATKCFLLLVCADLKVKLANNLINTVLVSSIVLQQHSWVLVNKHSGGKEKYLVHLSVWPNLQLFSWH